MPELTRWRSIGSVTVGEDWQGFPYDLVDTEVVMLRHFTTIDPFQKIWLTRYWTVPNPGGREVPWRLIYADQQEQIIHLPIPSEFRDVTAVFYNLQVKRRTPYYPVPWTIEAFTLI